MADTCESAPLLAPLLAPQGPRALRRQACCTLASCTGALSMGLALGWASPALLQLATSLHLSPAQLGWLGGLLPLGGLLAVPWAPWLLGRLGRRGTMQAASLPTLAGWLCLGLSRQLAPLYLGRLLLGLASALQAASVPVYLGEVATPSLRGALAGAFQALVVAGLLAMAAAGTLLSWRQLALFAAPLPCISLLLLHHLPPSPRWLEEQGRRSEAAQVRAWLADTEVVEEEEVEGGQADSQPSLSLQEVVRDGVSRRLVLYMVAISLCNQLCGSNVLITFTDTILARAGLAMEPGLAGLAVCALMLVATLASTPLIHRVDRKTVLASSLTFCSLSLAILATHFHLSPTSPSPIPLACLILHLVSFSLGMGPLTFTLLSDFSVPRLASVAATATGLAAWTSAGLLTLLFPVLEAAVGLPAVFGAFAALSGGGAGLAAWVLPETRGRSAAQVEAALRGTGQATVV